MKNYRMIVDAQKCVGCHACEVACKQEFQAPLGFFRTMTLYLDSGEFPNVKREFLPIMCSQCEDATCQKACTKDAIYMKNGIVHIDEKKCDGCGDCITACSLGAIYVNPFTKIAEKCNLCSHRLEVGMNPACVDTCVSNAITLIDDDTQIPYKAEPFKNHLFDKPRTLHIGANEKMKKKLVAGQSFSPLNYEIHTWQEM